MLAGIWVRWFAKMVYVYEVSGGLEAAVPIFLSLVGLVSVG